jgi:hypothetical protein
LQGLKYKKYKKSFKKVTFIRNLLNHWENFAPKWQICGVKEKRKNEKKKDHSIGAMLCIT